jgi:hypothetical protein
VSKNKAMQLELTKNKRAIAEARKELEMMRKKNREMESLVSLIQRAWSQLDIDTSLLLDGLGDPDVEFPASSSELLLKFVRSSENFLYQDPTNLQPLPQLNLDQWSTHAEIEKAKKLVLDSLSPIQDEDGTTQCFGEQIEEHLQNHISFTFSILERLCYAVSEGGGLSSSADTLKALQELKQSKAKESLLTDGITKLQTVMYNFECKYILSENQKMKAEKQLDKALQTIKDLEEKLSSRSETMPIDGSATKTSVSLTNNSEEVQDLLQQIATLERQLAESETAKAEAEMHLTERISRPMMQSDAQVADMRKAMEEVRAQSKQRVNAVLQEVRKNREVSKFLFSQ